jgi:hypothetical protein
VVVARLVPILVAVLVGACVTSPPHPIPGRLREAADLATDPARRASLQFTARAEDARIRSDLGTGQALAGRALRLDGQNPYAYLVLARVLADMGDYAEALRTALIAEERFAAEEPWNEPWQERTAALIERLRRESVAPSPAFDP